MEEYIEYERNKLKENKTYTDSNKYIVPDKVSTSLVVEDVQNVSTILKKSENQKETAILEDEYCTHWGLKRWIYGIKEYIIDRCLCCTMCGFDPMDKDRAYQNDEFTSDCCCVFQSWCNNPITGTLCFPLVATTHLLCLSCACSNPNKDDWWYKQSKQKEEKKKKEDEKIAFISKYSHNYSGSSYSSSNTTLYDGGFGGMNCPYYEGGLEVKYEYSTAGARMYMQPYSSTYCYNCGKIHKRR